MLIPVVLKDGHEELVGKDELQFLLTTDGVLFFKRSDGWTVLGRDKMRKKRSRYNGKDRREHDVFSLI